MMVPRISSNLLTNQMLFAKTDLTQDVILRDESLPENLDFQNITKLCILQLLINGSQILKNKYC